MIGAFYSQEEDETILEMKRSDPEVTWAEIGRALGRSGTSARRRLDRMQRKEN